MMTAEKAHAEMMRQYRMPATPEEGQRFSFLGWGIFIAFALAVLALTVYFG